MGQPVWQQARQLGGVLGLVVHPAQQHVLVADPTPGPLGIACRGLDELTQCTGTADTRLAQLQGRLKCGTNCGSCVPELKKLVRQQLKVA